MSYFINKTRAEVLTSAVALVVADQREGDDEGLTPRELVAQFRNTVVPWDSGPVMGAVRADYDPTNPTSLAVDMVLRASEDELANVLSPEPDGTTRA
jgi:hypothetical protein